MQINKENQEVFEIIKTFSFAHFEDYILKVGILVVILIVNSFCLSTEW